MRRWWLWAGLLGLALVLAACGGSGPTTRATAQDDRPDTEPPTVVVYKSPTCGCCGAWANQMRMAGFRVQEKPVQNLMQVKQEHGVPQALLSCHTAVVEGYVIEGHVPPEQVQRLLDERPEGVVGLAVPGMPVGSPGMEAPGRGVEPYSVLAFDGQGNTEVYATYP